MSLPSSLSAVLFALFGYKKYTVALATVEIYPEIFHILSVTVELGGKWSGRRQSRFISVSKKDLSDVFVSSGNGCDTLLLWASSEQAIGLYISTRDSIWKF